jgi:hypothetical protein
MFKRNRWENTHEEDRLVVYQLDDGRRKKKLPKALFPVSFKPTVVIVATYLSRLYHTYVIVLVVGVQTVDTPYN